MEKGKGTIIASERDGVRRGTKVNAGGNTRSYLKLTHKMVETTGGRVRSGETMKKGEGTVYGHGKKRQDGTQGGAGILCWN